MNTKRNIRDENLLMSQLRRYADIFSEKGDLLNHDIDVIRSVLVKRDEQYVREKYHCEDKVCKAILDNYEYRLPAEIDIEYPIKPVEVTQVNLSPPHMEIQRVSIMDQGKYDYCYQTTSVRLTVKRNENDVFLMVGDDDHYFDCVFCSSEDNLHAKPHHYRRAVAISRGMHMQPSRESGNLYVVDAYPYRANGTGGYFERSDPNIVRAKVIKSKKYYEVCVYSTGASGTEWQRIGLVQQMSKTPYIRYNMLLGREEGASEFSHSYEDYLKIKNPQPYNIMRRERISEGEFTFFSWKINRGTNYGLRRGVQQICSMYPCMGYIYNKGDNCEGNIMVRQDEYGVLTSQLMQYTHDRGFKMMLLDVKQVGYKSVDCKVVICVDPESIQL